MVTTTRTERNPFPRRAPGRPSRAPFLFVSRRRACRSRRYHQAISVGYLAIRAKPPIRDGQHIGKSGQSVRSWSWNGRWPPAEIGTEGIKPCWTARRSPTARTPTCSPASSSNVRSYARSFSAIFTYARGTELRDVHGKRYLDFLAGAGSLNYGHNNAVLKEALVDYIMQDGITHSARPAHRRQGALPADHARRHPGAARPRRLRHAVHRPDRHQRGRSRAQDRPQGHRPPERHLLHQRLPRRVAGRAGGDRQLIPARRRRHAARQHHRHAVRRLLRRGRRHHHAPREACCRIPRAAWRLRPP